MRKLILMLMFAANLIMLAHAVIPHHHHELAVCVIPEHCHHCEDVNSDSGKSHDHHHSHGGDSQKCSLNQVILTHPVSRFHFASYSSADDHPDFLLVNGVLTEDAGAVVSPDTTVQLFLIFSTRILHRELPGGRGMRAPPLS